MPPPPHQIMNVVSRVRQKVVGRRSLTTQNLAMQKIKVVGDKKIVPLGSSFTVQL